MGRPLKDLTGQTFGRLIVVVLASRGKNSKWWCVCTCGKRTQVFAAGLKNGSSTSCGCAARELNAKAHQTHGLSRTPEHKIWSGMLDRCTRKNSPAYKHYGGRGIKVCKRWKKFENFYADMGSRPSTDLSLDRIDNDRGYSPDNCRWATKEEQNNNYRDTIKVTVDGVETPLAILARQRGINHGTLSRRWHVGWPEELLFSQQDHRIKFVVVEGARMPLRKALVKYGVKLCTYNKRIQRGMTDAEALLTKVRVHG